MIEIGKGGSFWDKRSTYFQHQAVPGDHNKLGIRDEETPIGPPKEYVPEDPPFPEGAVPPPAPAPHVSTPPEVSDWTNH